MAECLTIKEFRQTVTAPMAQRGVVHAVVFGSVSRVNMTPASDVYFLVEFQGDPQDQFGNPLRWIRLHQRVGEECSAPRGLHVSVFGSL